jgi:hypothetical protein
VFEFINVYVLELGGRGGGEYSVLFYSGINVLLQSYSSKEAEIIFLFYFIK